MQTDGRHRTPSEAANIAFGARHFVAPFQAELGPLVGAAARLLAISGVRHLSRTEALDRLADSRIVSDHLNDLSVRFERAAAERGELANHGRVSDLRKSIASTQSILERARFALEARSKSGGALPTQNYNPAPAQGEPGGASGGQLG